MGIVLCVLAYFSLVLQLFAQVMPSDEGPQDSSHAVVGNGRSGHSKP